MTKELKDKQKYTLTYKKNYPWLGSDFKRQMHKIAYTTVMGDLFHYGHLRILLTAKESADLHICGILSDKACENWWGTLICNFKERKGVIENLQCVDRILKQSSIDPTENLKLIQKEYSNSKLVLA